jgi:hypothetical protein
MELGRGRCPGGRGRSARRGLVARWAWRFRFQPKELLEEFVDRRSSSLDEMRRDLIARMQLDLDANRVLRLMGSAFQLSSVLFLIETFAWLVAVADL